VAASTLVFWRVLAALLLASCGANVPVEPNPVGSGGRSRENTSTRAVNRAGSGVGGSSFVSSSAVVETFEAGSAGDRDADIDSSVVALDGSLGRDRGVVDAGPDAESLEAGVNQALNGSLSDDGGVVDASTDAGGFDAGVNPGDGGPYNGVVAVMLERSSTSTTYSALAEFGPGTFGDYLYSAAGCENCCCFPIEGVAMTNPCLSGARVPDAATVTVASAGGANVLATITPTAPCQVFETVELGAWGDSVITASDRQGAALSNYAIATSQPYDAGAALGVSAPGNAVGAFAGTLQTPQQLSGVSPALASGAVTIDTTHELTVTWTPEGRANETVVLVLEGLTTDLNLTTCFCNASDFAGSLVVDAGVMGQFQPTNGTIMIERILTTTTSADDATITLVGSDVTTASVLFQ
jgi:hypothetical protein